MTHTHRDLWIHIVGVGRHSKEVIVKWIGSKQMLSHPNWSRNLLWYIQKCVKHKKQFGGECAEQQGVWYICSHLRLFQKTFTFFKGLYATILCIYLMQWYTSLYLSHICRETEWKWKTWWWLSHTNILPIICFIVI